MVDFVEVARLSARQHGLVTRAQLRELGVSDDAIRWRTARGEWTIVQRGVIHVAAAPFTWHSRVLAACLSGPAVASHRTAALLQGLDGFRPGSPEVIVARAQNFNPEGVRVHEVRDFDLRDEQRRAGIPTCGINVVLFQLAGLIGFEATGAAMDDAIRQRRTDWPELYRTLVLHARRGRKGSALFRTLLDMRWGTRVPDSRWNRQAADLVVDAGLPAPTLEHEVRRDDGTFVARVDLAWPAWRYGVELQSLRYHFGARSFEREPVRRNAIQACGWVISEYTWRYYVDHPAAFCNEIAAELYRRQPRTASGDAR